jgi:hypothetical protein
MWKKEPAYTPMQNMSPMSPMSPMPYNPYMR